MDTRMAYRLLDLEEGTAMPLYEFALPKYSNSKASNDWAIQAWRKTAMSLAGGVTSMPEAMGSWRDENDGQVFVEPMLGHRVACSRETAERLLAEAFKLFDDQRAIMVSQIGQAVIVDRPKVTEAVS